MPRPRLPEDERSVRMTMRLAPETLRQLKEIQSVYRTRDDPAATLASTLRRVVTLAHGQIINRSDDRL